MLVRIAFILKREGIARGSDSQEVHRRVRTIRSRRASPSEDKTARRNNCPGMRHLTRGLFIRMARYSLPQDGIISVAVLGELAT